MMRTGLCVLFAVTIASIAAAAMTVDEAESGLRAGSTCQGPTETALQSEGTSALPLLENLMKSEIPGVAVRAAKIRRWIILELEESHLPLEIRSQLVDLKTAANLGPELWAREVRERHPDAQDADAVLTRAAVFGPVRTFALLYEHLPEMGMDDYLVERYRRKIAELLAPDLPDSADFRVDGLSSPLRAMMVNVLATRNKRLPRAYLRWLDGHEDLRNGLEQAALDYELTRLESAGALAEVLGLYQSVRNNNIRDHLRRWLDSRRALVAKLDPASFGPCEAAGYLEFLYVPETPLGRYDIYQAVRTMHPEIASCLMPQTAALEAVWLAEHGNVHQGFRLAQQLGSGPAAERIGSWLRGHPEARQPRIPVMGDPGQPGFGQFIAGFAPLEEMLEPAEEDRLAAAFDAYADNLWLDLARRTNQHRLYFLCMARRDRLMDGVKEVAEMPAPGPGLRALGDLLANRPPWLAKLAPERIPPHALAHLAGGMLDGGASAAEVAAVINRWLPHDPGIYNKLTSDELKPVVEHGKARP